MTFDETTVITFLDIPAHHKTRYASNGPGSLSWDLRHLDQRARAAVYEETVRAFFHDDLRAFDDSLTGKGFVFVMSDFGSFELAPIGERNLEERSYLAFAVPSDAPARTVDGKGRVRVKSVRPRLYARLNEPASFDSEELARRVEQGFDYYAWDPE